MHIEMLSFLAFSALLTLTCLRSSLINIAQVETEVKYFKINGENNCWANGIISLYESTRKEKPCIMNQTFRILVFTGRHFGMFSEPGAGPKAFSDRRKRREFERLYHAAG